MSLFSRTSRLIATNHSCSSIKEFDNVVTVLVGQEEKPFILHQDLVCAKSKFFKAACSKQWLEGQDRVVQLPEIEAATFRWYSLWVYSDKLEGPTFTVESDSTERAAERESIVKLYLLGDSLDDVGLRNKTNELLFKTMRTQRKLIDPEIINLAWESTLPKCPLRKMLIDVHVSRKSWGDFAEHISEYPVEFLQELAVAALRARKISSWDVLAQRLPQYAEIE